MNHDYTRIIAIILMLSIALFVFLWPGTGRAETIMYVCTKNDQLNIRDEANIHSKCVFRLDRGDEVIVHRVRSGWAYIEWCGDYGWASIKYLSDKPPVIDFLAVEVD